LLFDRSVGVLSCQAQWGILSFCVLWEAGLLVPLTEYHSFLLLSGESSVFGLLTEKQGFSCDRSQWEVLGLFVP
jgi:hypothetical protein